MHLNTSEQNVIAQYVFTAGLVDLFMFTPCLSIPAESTPENSPVKIWCVKSLPGKKRFDFLPPWQCCITYFTPEKYRIIDSPQWIFQFYSMSFDITPVILLILLGVWQHLIGITVIRGNSFSRYFRLNFLVTIHWFLHFLLAFYDELQTGCYLLTNF